ncbi:MAG: hypothetical protein ACYC6G_18440 [Desulfobaccales bacterium]
MVIVYTRLTRFPIIALTVLISFAIAMGICGNAFCKGGWEEPPIDLNLIGKIETPPSGTQVKRHFGVEGTITSGKPRNLWLIERIGNQHWPKEPKLVAREGHWEGEVFEGGRPPGGRFEILLVDVSDALSKKFEDWLKIGHRTGQFSGISALDLRNMIILDSKAYKLEDE